MKKIQTLILLTFALTSCKLTDHLNISDKIPLTKENISSFSGRYSDFPDTVVGTSKAYDGPIKKLSLSCAISKTGTASRVNDGSYFVQLNFKSDRQLDVTLLHQGQLMTQYSIYGKIKDGYFYRRKYFAFSPFIPVFFGYTFGQSRIKMTTDGLTVDNKSKYWWFMLIAGGARTLNCSSTYKRL